MHIDANRMLYEMPWCLLSFSGAVRLQLQEVLDLQLAVQMRDDHLAECQRQSDIDQQQVDELERQVLMQVRCPAVA